MAIPSLLKRLNISPAAVLPQAAAPQPTAPPKAKAETSLHTSSNTPSSESLGPSSVSAASSRPQQIPEVLWSQLYDHQKSGVRWLLARLSVGQSCVLADDMGLGKTLQAIACLVHMHRVHCTPPEDAKRITAMHACAEAAQSALAAEVGMGGWRLTAPQAAKHMQDAPFPSLVVVPNSVVAQWCAAAQRWSRGGLCVQQLTSDSSSETVAQLLQRMIERTVDVIVTTHSCVAALAVRQGQHRRGGVVAASLASVPLGVLVVDEAHNCTTADGVAREAIQALNAQARLLLTGTAMSHGAGDLLSLLAFGECLSDAAWLNLFRRLAEHGVRNSSAIASVAPFRLATHVSVAEYGRRVQGALTRCLRQWRAPESTPGEKERAAALTAELDRCSAPHVLRRSKASVLADCLPAKHSVVLFCRLRRRQRALYAAAASDAIARGSIAQGLWQRVFALYKRMAATNTASEFLLALGKAVSPAALGDAFAGDAGAADQTQAAAGEAKIRMSSGDGVWEQPCVRKAAEAEGAHLPAFVAFIGDRISPYKLERRVLKGESFVRQVTLRKLAQGKEFLQPAAGCTPLQARLETALAADIATHADSLQHKQPAGEAEVESNDPDASSKLSVLLQIMSSLFRAPQRNTTAAPGSEQPDATPREAQPDRVLIFSHAVRVLDFIREHLRRAGFSVVAIDGRDGRGSARDAVVRAINDPLSGVHAACISTTAGGEGLNLTGANVVVHWDVGFSPAKQRQAEDRAYRLGQRRDVLVLTLVAQGTIEETMLYRQLTKEWEARLLLDGQANDAFIRQEEVFGPASLWRCARDGFFDEFREHWLQLREQGILAPDASLPSLCMGPVQTSTYAGLLERQLQHASVAGWLDLHAVEHRGGGGASNPPPPLPLRLGDQTRSAAASTAAPAGGSKRPRLFAAAAPRLLSPAFKAPRTGPAAPQAPQCTETTGRTDASAAAVQDRVSRGSSAVAGSGSVPPPPPMRGARPLAVAASPPSLHGRPTSGGEAGALASEPLVARRPSGVSPQSGTLFEALRAQVSLQLD